LLSKTGKAENRLLALLPAAERERWQAHLELVDLPLGQVIHEPGAEVGYAVFPLTAIVSLLYVMENGRRPGHRVDVQGGRRRPSRFKSSRTVAAHFGLTPRRPSPVNSTTPVTSPGRRQCAAGLGPHLPVPA